MRPLWLLFLMVVTVTATSDKPILIIVSYDAFRYNYVDRNLTEYMAFLKQYGTSARFIRNIFPTKTFPNHHSIATGVYPEVHGVVGNSFYDPDLKKTVGISDPKNMYNYNPDALPIWVSMIKYFIIAKVLVKIISYGFNLKYFPLILFINELWKKYFEVIFKNVNKGLSLGYCI